MTEEEKRRAIENGIPRKPIKQELGGGYYYKCPMLICGESIKRYYDYCPTCGAKIDWSDDYER